MRVLLFLIYVSVALLSGCISVPDEAYIIRQIADSNAAGIINGQKLSSDEFSLLSWNIYKGRKKGWYDDLLRFYESTDLLLIQEARLNGAMRQILESRHTSWSLVTAFILNNVETGILTASVAAPFSEQIISEEEPLTGIPKTALISLFPLSSADSILLVANIHAVNLSLGTVSFNQQWRKLYELVAEHSGPVIVAGDFNTWSDERMAIAKSFVQDLGLTAVVFEPDRRTPFAGKPVDHIYFRGLLQIETTVPVVSSADHNPLLVTFRLAEDR
jgi:endonuclease/exonuclease/phosphatase (EEP) superfamily protein YafD